MIKSTTSAGKFNFDTNIFVKSLEKSGTFELLLRKSEAAF